MRAWDRVKRCERKFENENIKKQLEDQKGDWYYKGAGPSNNPANEESISQLQAITDREKVDQ